MSYFYIKAREIRTTNGLKMIGNDNINFVKINVPSGISNTLTLNFPDTMGIDGQFLKLSGVVGNIGNLEFATVSGEGGTINADDIADGSSNVSLSTTNGNVDINTDNGSINLSVDNSNSIIQKIGTNNIVITDDNNMIVNANIIANNHNLEANELKLNSNSNILSIQANSVLEANYSLILPSNIGSINDLLYISNASTGDLAFSNSITEINSGNILSNIQTIAGTVSSSNVQVIENFTSSGSYGNIANNTSLAAGAYSSNVNVSSFGRYARLYYQDSSISIYDSLLVEVSPDNGTNWLYYNILYPSTNDSYRQGALDININSITNVRIKNISSSSTYNNVYCSIVG
jgi:hypothetical protein